MDDGCNFREFRCTMNVHLLPRKREKDLTVIFAHIYMH